MKDSQYYLGLPYTVVIKRDEDGDFVARVQELPGCSTHGKTAAEATEAIQEVQAAWIEECLKNGQPVPEPVPEDALPSGKFLLRVPRSLHRDLAEMARRENVSLNQLVTTLLARAIEATRVQPPLDTIEVAAVGLGHSLANCGAAWGHFAKGNIVWLEDQQSSGRHVVDFVDAWARTLPNHMTGELEEADYGWKKEGAHA
jgi:antitoxin HicB